MKTPRASFRFFRRMKSFRIAIIIHGSQTLIDCSHSTVRIAPASGVWRAATTSLRERETLVRPRLIMLSYFSSSVYYVFTRSVLCSSCVCLLIDEFRALNNNFVLWTWSHRSSSFLRLLMFYLWRFYRLALSNWNNTITRIIDIQTHTHLINLKFSMCAYFIYLRWCLWS